MTTLTTVTKKNVSITEEAPREEEARLTTEQHTSLSLGATMYLTAQ